MQIHPGLLMFYSFPGFAEPDCMSWTFFFLSFFCPHLTLFVVSHSKRIMHHNGAIRRAQMLIKEDARHNPGGLFTVKASVAPEPPDSGEV